jgi:hypothetical protein
VRGCQREPTVTQAILCEPHARQFRQRAGKPTIGQYLADPRVRPLPPFIPSVLVWLRLTSARKSGS